MQPNIISPVSFEPKRASRTYTLAEYLQKEAKSFGGGLFADAKDLSECGNLEE